MGQIQPVVPEARALEALAKNLVANFVSWCRKIRKIGWKAVNSSGDGVSGKSMASDKRKVLKKIEDFFIVQLRNWLNIEIILQDAAGLKLLRSLILTHFANLEYFKMPDNKILYGCYHPSPRNVNTGRINEKEMIKFLDLVYS